MLTLESTTKTDQGYTAIIAGKQGRVEIKDLMWIDDNQDLLAIIYTDAQAVLAGIYHCCLSIPGKVTLL